MLLMCSTLLISSSALLVSLDELAVAHSIHRPRPSLARRCLRVYPGRRLCRHPGE